MKEANPVPLAPCFLFFLYLSHSSIPICRGKPAAAAVENEITMWQWLRTIPAAAEANYGIKAHGCVGRHSISGRHRRRLATGSPAPPACATRLCGTIPALELSYSMSQRFLDKQK
jgi:hypothetical protein